MLCGRSRGNLEQKIMGALDESMEDGPEEVVVLSPIANPLATAKISKKILKLVKTGHDV